jgi:hypothetical protein
MCGQRQKVNVTHRDFTLLTLNMFARLGTDKPFGVSEVNQMEYVLLLPMSHTYVFRPHISMNKVFVMQVIQSVYNLNGN